MEFLSSFLFPYYELLYSDIFCFHFSDSELGHTVTNMISSKYGIGQIFMDKWPIFLGVGIVVIFALMIVFALYKTNSFEIFRFFKNKIDEEERLLRQKRSSHSTMRSFSRQDSPAVEILS